MEAVIMTGGQGMRMRPYTNVLPKGLLPVGEKPILEILVRQLRTYGCTSLTMMCGYLAPLIQAYFGDGAKWNVKIRYEVELEPLGTAGALRQLAGRQEPVLVMNCDVLTTLHFKEMYDFHCAGDALLTVASQRKQVPFEYGVLTTEREWVMGIEEKPVQSACVNMGMYIVSPEALAYIPQKGRFDMPDLIMALLADEKPVRHYENNAFWLDIGRPSDYTRANEAAGELANRLIPGERL